MKRTKAVLLVVGTIVAVVVMVGAMSARSATDLNVLKGKKPDLSLHVGRGARNITYLFKGDFEKVSSQVEQQLGKPFEKYRDPGYASWERPGESVSVSMGKLALSKEEYEGQLRRQKASGLSGMEWLKSEGGDKWITVQIQRKPSAFSQLWFSFLDFFLR